MLLHILIPALLLFNGLARAENVALLKSSVPEEELPTIRHSQTDHKNPTKFPLETLGSQEPVAGSYNPSDGQPNSLTLTPGREFLGSFHSRHRHSVAYHGPPPPPPLKSQAEATERLFTLGTPGEDLWLSPTSDTPKIVSLDVKCESNLMKVFLVFDKPFFGIVFSKGHYSNPNCVHVAPGYGRTSASFDVSVHACGTAGNTDNGLYGYGSDSGSGSFFENIIVIQYDPQVQEVWDQARKLRCTWHDQYEKSVTFRPFPVDVLDVVRADFAGDNVGCWMQIQVGKGPWASEVSGLVKIGQTMTMVLAIKDDDSKFDMLVRNCMAHDGKRAPIQLVDLEGCITRSKLMSRFTKIRNFGASATVLSYAHFQAFKFPDSMEVHFQCTIQICRYRCPEQCSESTSLDLEHSIPEDRHSGFGLPAPLAASLGAYLQTAEAGGPRDERRRKSRGIAGDEEKTVGVNRIISVVSTGDLTFSIEEVNQTAGPAVVYSTQDAAAGPPLICMTTPSFAAMLVVLLGILLASCILSAYLCVRLRPFENRIKRIAAMYGR